MIKFYEKHKRTILVIVGALVFFFAVAVITNGDAIFSVN